MNGIELKALRKGMALTQEGLAKKIGVSRKTINELEGSDEVDSRTAMTIQALARQMKLVEDTFWVEQSKRDTHIVVRRTVREYLGTRAMYHGHSEVMLYGEFSRREDAYRWSAALRLANNPRNTRKLIREREAEREKRDAA